MEDLLSSKVSANPVRDVWSLEHFSGNEKICEGRVLVVSHYLPFACQITPEEPSDFSGGFSEGGSGDDRPRGGAGEKGSSGNLSLVGGRRLSTQPMSPMERPRGEPNPEQVRAQLSGLSVGSMVTSSRGVEIPSLLGISGAGTGKRGSVGSIVTQQGRKEGFQWTIRPSQNGNIGLFNAVNAVQERLQRVYIGECEAEVPKVIQDDLAAELGKLDCIPVFTTASEAQGHYHSFCKQILWPMFHYTVPNFQKGYNIKDKAWKDYCAVSQKFADVIVENYKPGDFIWVHDYHLILVPQIVRKRLPEANIGFFLHIPFPSSEIFRCLHVRNELLDGMLGANVVGFQTYSFSRHFLHTCSRLKGVDTTPSSVQLDSHVVYVGIFPIGIDVKTLSLKRQAPEVGEIADIIQRRYADQKILIGREKLDNIKGVPNKLLAFEMFLNMYPEWVGKVVLIQVALIGSANKELHTQVFDIVSRINGKFGSLEYSPVVYLHQNIPFFQYLALLSVADVCIITSLRDGMNLTSHEYVVCQAAKHSPLILSEFAGTYGSFGGAIRVNPWDYNQVAQSIYEALTMPEEDRVSRHQELLKYVTVHTAQFWTESFLRQMAKMSAFTISHPMHDITEISRGFQDASRRLILLGYDGTLCKIRRRPEQASPSEEILHILQKLAANPKNVVCVLTGRNKKLADRWLSSVPNLYVSAEAGCLLKRNGEPWTKLLQDTDLSWRNAVLDVLEYYTERTEGSEIEQKDFSFTWHYRNAEQIFGAWQAKECFNHLSEVITDKYPIITANGNKAIEIQPVNVSKATVVRHLLARVLPNPDFILCIGSDKFDEGMFEYLEYQESTPVTLQPSPIIETVAVGTKNTKAQGYLANSAKVADLLTNLSRF